MINIPLFIGFHTSQVVQDFQPSTVVPFWMCLFKSMGDFFCDVFFNLNLVGEIGVWRLVVYMYGLFPTLDSPQH